jgi:hypothetical protein
MSRPACLPVPGCKHAMPAEAFGLLLLKEKLADSKFFTFYFNISPLSMLHMNGSSAQ